MWNIDGRSRVDNNGYIYVRLPEHPYATSTGYVYEHRVVMENHIGRMLNPREVVHHIDGDKKNNDITNLELLSLAEHSEKHKSMQMQKLVKLKCPACGRTFLKRYGATHLVPSRDNAMHATFCSSKCRGTMSRKSQLHRLTEQDTTALENCVISIDTMPHEKAVDLYNDPLIGNFTIFIDE